MKRSAFISLTLLALAGAPARAQRPAPKNTEYIRYFRMKSRLLTEFWGRDIFLEAGVVLPPKGRTKPPICINIHGFGGSHLFAWWRGPRLVKAMRTRDYPRMVYVFPRAQFSLGHHEFADSVNNGPWGRAMISELVPALEREFKAGGSPAARFLTGHSSGGWSSLWLMVNYPDFFGGTWSTAPDSVDFRDFTGINIYEYTNAYVDPQGREIPLVRRGGKWAMTVRQFVEREIARRSYGGQFASFDAVFSPRGEDGRPMPLFDRKSGKIDPFVARAWKKYDIALLLKRNWKTLGPRLRGKLHVYVGSLDTFRLEGAVRLLKRELKTLGSDATILIVEGRDHGSLMRPHPKYWPEGMMEHIHRAMWASHGDHREN